MKKRYIIYLFVLIIIFIVGFIRYLNDPILFLNDRYKEIKLPYFSTKVVFDKEQWNWMGDGCSCIYLKIDKNTFFKLKNKSKKILLENVNMNTIKNISKLIKVNKLYLYNRNIAIIKNCKGFFLLYKYSYPFDDQKYPFYNKKNPFLN